jgi:chromosome segregation ATPase
MSEIVAVIGVLENKIEQLLNKIDHLKAHNHNLEQQLTQANNFIVSQKQEQKSLVLQYETLKMANALLGSNDNKKEVKLKINSLIREIDYCITQLS